MQVIMYARRQYDANLIQQISEALKKAWPLDELDLVIIFDTSSALICEVPTMVRIFIPLNNRNSMTMVNLNAPSKSSHYDAIRLFQHFESTRKSQLIFIEKNTDAMNVGSKVIKPEPLKFLENTFSILYQDENEHGSELNVFHMHQNPEPSEIYHYIQTQTSAIV